MLRDIVIRNRSYRRFDQSRAVAIALLTQLVEIARYCPSARNLQPLKYILVNEPSLCNRFFDTLGCAGYLKDWEGPEEGERPSAYIIILEDQNISSSTLWDLGIVAQIILLGAVEQGMGGCIIASVNKSKIEKKFNLPPHLNVALVIALGYPVGRVVIEPMPDSGSVVYCRNENKTHNVPKRSIDELIWKY